MRAAALLMLFLTVVAAAAGGAARRPAPTLTGMTLAGKPVSLAAMRGKPVFINVWSSW